MNQLLNFASLICVIVLLLTAIARLNDISRTQMSMTWQFRRLGMTLSGVGSLGTAVLIMEGRYGPRLWETLLLVGITLSWITTPNHPPWWKYITRGGALIKPKKGDDNEPFSP